MPIATAYAVSASGVVGPALPGTIVYGWSITETAGAVAEVQLLDGGSGGTIIADVNLAAKGNTGPLSDAPFRCTAAGGLYFKVVAGAVRGGVYAASAER